MTLEAPFVFTREHLLKRLEWKAQRKWLDIRPILAYNAQLNYIVGIRGGGKTYAFKTFCIDRFLEKGQQFIWVRRYLIELEKTIKNFFGKMKRNKYLNEKYGEITYVVRGQDFYINGKLAGTGIALSQSQAYKSSEYPEVINVVFDEFISETKYLSNEYTLWFGLMETIQRDGRVKFFMLGNSVKFNNPYFIQDRIKPFVKGFKYFKDKKLLVYMYNNKWFLMDKMKSDFGKLTKDTEFFQYAFMNTFKDTHDKFIGKKPNDSRYICSIKYEGVEYSYYYEKTSDRMYVVRGQVANRNNVYVVNEKDHDINYKLIANVRGTLMLFVKQCYVDGRLLFENQVVREKNLELFTLL